MNQLRARRLREMNQFACGLGEVGELTRDGTAIAVDRSSESRENLCGRGVQPLRPIRAGLTPQEERRCRVSGAQKQRPPALSCGRPWSRVLLPDETR